MNHAQLRKSLAAHLDSAGPPPWAVVQELTLGPSWTAPRYARPGVADVFAVRVSWSNLETVIYEVKANRGDFLSDLRGEPPKWRKYLPFCDRLLFAAPAGVIGKTELPAEVGIMEFNDASRTWRCRRRGRQHATNIPIEVYLSALFRIRDREHPTAERARRMAELSSYLSGGGSSLGNKIRGRLRDLETAKRKAEGRADRLESVLREVNLPVDSHLLSISDP